LVDDRVNRDGGFAGLPVTDDKLSLTSSNRHKRIHRFQPGLHRLVHGFAHDDPGRFDLHAPLRDVGKRAFAVDDVAEAVNDPAEKAHAHGDVDDGAWGSRGKKVFREGG
jgi:hypothetical protein